MDTIPEFYFKNTSEWRDWLEENHLKVPGAYLIFYKVSHSADSMRWEEAVRVALCYGWIDSTVKSLGEGKRRQYFCPRKPKSSWSKLNKTYIEELSILGLMHESGMNKVEEAMRNGAWNSLDTVEEGMVPPDLQKAFDKSPAALENFNNFSFSYRKSYLYWLNQAKLAPTRRKRISEIVKLCKANIKSRP